MKWIVLFLSIFFLIVVQASFSSFLAPFSFANLVLIFVVMVSIFGSTKEVTVVTVISALMLDFSSGLTDGLLLTSFIATVFSIRLMVNWFFSKEEDIKVLLGSVFFGTVIFFLVTLLINQLFGIFNQAYVLDYYFLLTRKVWLDLFLNLVFTYPIMYYYFFVQKFTKTHASV
ncbi:MAG: hypothetical protein Q8P83_02685 [bacterium]|nr:hypothetical protein [bacterium]